MGVICGMVFLTSMFLFIPFVFYDQLVLLRQVDNQVNFLSTDLLIQLTNFLSALLSIACMILLGFADDVLNLKWRHKLLLPTVATIPLLVVYLVAFDKTYVVLPKILRPWVPDVIDLGIFPFSLSLLFLLFLNLIQWLGYFYYLYMGMLAVFCTNSINILAGINGVEAGQSLIIAISIAIYNFLQIAKGETVEDQTFSLCFLSFLFFFFLCFVFTSYASTNQV